MGPTQALVNADSAQVGHTATATAFAETSQATQLSSMPPPSALPASKVRRAEMAVDTSGHAPEPIPMQQVAGPASSMLPPSSAPDEGVAMSQPDIFGFGFDMDASQAEPTNTVTLETAPADVQEHALPGVTVPEAATAAPELLTAASQPDVFNLGFDVDAAQAAPTSMATSSQPGTIAVAASQQHADAEGAAVSQRDVFTFDCDFDASQAGGASQQGSGGSRAVTETGRDDGDEAGSN